MIQSRDVCDVISGENNNFRHSRSVRKVVDGVRIIGRWVLLLTLLGCGMLPKLLGVLVLSKKVVLGINLCNRREPDKALIGASSLSS